MNIGGMPKDFHRSILLAEGIEQVISYLAESINGKFYPVYPSEIEINLSFGNATISDGGGTACGLVEEKEALRKAKFLLDFLVMPAGRQAIICTGQNAIDLSWSSTTCDEIQLCTFDETGWSTPNFVLQYCRYHQYRITPA